MIRKWEQGVSLLFIWKALSLSILSHPFFNLRDASGELDRLSPLIDTLLAGIALGALFSAGIIYSKDSDSGCYLLTILVSTNNAEVTPDFLLNDCLSRSGTPAITYRGTQCLSQIPSPIDAFCLNEQGVVIVTDERIRAAIQIHGKKMLMKNDANTIWNVQQMIADLFSHEMKEELEQYHSVEV